MPINYTYKEGKDMKVKVKNLKEDKLLQTEEQPKTFDKANPKAMSPKMMARQCFGTKNYDEEMIKVLLNGYDFVDLYNHHLSCWDPSEHEDYIKLEKFFTGIRNCAEAFGKQLGMAQSIMLQPYLAIDYSTELDTLEKLINFYIFTGERIYDITNNTSGVIILDVG